MFSEVSFGSIALPPARPRDVWLPSKFTVKADAPDRQLPKTDIAASFDRLVGAGE